MLGHLHMDYLCEDTGWSLEDLPSAMENRDGWPEILREFCALSVTSIKLKNTCEATIFLKINKNCYKMHKNCYISQPDITEG